MPKTIEMKVNDMSLYHQRGARNGCQYIMFGNAKAGIEEKKCENSVCRVIGVTKDLIGRDDKTLVINQYGNLYSVYLANFEEVNNINVLQ